LGDEVLIRALADAFLKLLEIVEEATTGATATHIEQQLPDEFRPLFESGSQGDTRTN